MAWQAIQETGRGLGPVVADVPPWVWATVVSLALVLAAVRVLGPLTSPSAGAPTLLLTRATLEPVEGDPHLFRLDAGFSNVHTDPVQLIRIVGQTGDARRAVSETTVLVLPRREIDLEAELLLEGRGTGWLDLYLLVPKVHHARRAWRLRTPIVYHPESDTYSATILQQRLTVVEKMPDATRVRGDVPIDPSTMPPVAERAPLEFPDDF